MTETWSSPSPSSSWPILRGCLDDVVTCESSISAIDDSDSGADLTTRKSPLVLRRPSLVSSPCEISLLFTQQHEIKQVYIRSTAKVYEIYYATNEKSGNEYLCTVRCGIVPKDEELQLETDGVGSVSTTSSRSIDEVHSRTESGSSTDGDGWVDIKLNKSSRVDSGDTSLSKKEERCLIQVNQECFEATAEISDGDPVMSITFRLLSIQSGDHIYIDEVYVFADPVASADNHCSVSSLETSSGSAMLSMFIPTLMQLSKSRMSKVQEHSGFAGERSMNQDTEQHSTGTAVTSTNIVQKESLPSLANNGAFVHQPNHLLQLPNSHNRTQFTFRENDIACNKMEQTLHELVSRVTKIEEFFLRFEENMLKPIINMETRLERVEQHLESYIKNPQFIRTGCSRYSAPEFSCNESESDSMCIGGNDSPVTLRSESSKKHDCCPQELCIPTLKSESTLESESIRASQLLPGLSISAPDYSNTDDEEAINAFEAVTGSPKVMKKPMSIDDALASALAGFVTSALTKPLKCNVAVGEAEMVCRSALSMALEKQLEFTEMVEQEDFSDMEGAANKFVLASVDSDEHQLSSAPIGGGNTSSKDAVVTEEQYVAVVNGGEETTEGVDGNNHVLCEGGSKTSNNSSVDSLGGTKEIAEIGYKESCHDASQTFDMDFCDSLSFIDSALLKNVDSFSDGKLNACPAVLQDIIQLQSPAKVDFSVPVLDVKFSSSDNKSAKSSLVSLLVDKPDIECDVPCVREDDMSSYNETYDLVVVVDENSGDVEIDNSKLLYDDDYNSAYMASETEQQDSSYCSNEDMCASLI